MDKWTRTEGWSPQLLKIRMRVDLEPAWEMWIELIQKGWRRVDN